MRVQDNCRIPVLVGHSLDPIDELHIIGVLEGRDDDTKERILIVYQHPLLQVGGVAQLCSCFYDLSAHFCADRILARTQYA